MKAVVEGLVATTIILGTFLTAYIVTTPPSDESFAGAVEPAPLIAIAAVEPEATKEVEPVLQWSEDEDEPVENILNETREEFEEDAAKRAKRLRRKLQDIEFEAIDGQRETRENREKLDRQQRERDLASQLSQVDRNNVYKREQEKNRRQRERHHDELMRALNRKN